MNSIEENSPPKSKRGRKSKAFLEQQNLLKKSESQNSILSSVDENVEKILKKRGRKPKGGKIVQQSKSDIESISNIKQNIILHLKCSLQDLEEEQIYDSDINPFSFSNTKNELEFEPLNGAHDVKQSIHYKVIECTNNDFESALESPTVVNNKINDTKIIFNKLKELQNNLHLNNINDRKSACFWCTYEFDNPAIHIPKFIMNESYHVYGCFCSPECSVAYLMEENIDTTSKFERYYLLNNLYAKIYNYTKNIKPAPNPRYLLNKFYGNLTIQEYREMLNSERLFLIVDKPLTRMLPEIHEDNDDFLINNKIIPSNSYQLKRKSKAKNTILNEQFGLN